MSRVNNGKVYIYIYKEEEILAQNVYHNSYYLIANQHLLQKIIYIFKDVFLCLL